MFELTDAGRKALAEYLKQPARFPRIQHEAALRMLAGEHLEREEILSSLAGLEADLAELDALLDETEPILDAMPEPKRSYRRLGQPLARRLVAVHADWLAEVRRELAGDDAGPKATRGG